MNNLFPWSFTAIGITLPGVVLGVKVAVLNALHLAIYTAAIALVLKLILL